MTITAESTIEKSIDFHMSPNEQLINSNHEMDMSPHLNSIIRSGGATQDKNTSDGSSNGNNSNGLERFSDEYSGRSSLLPNGSCFTNIHDTFNHSEGKSSFLDDYSPVPVFPISRRGTNSTSTASSGSNASISRGISSFTLQENTHNYSQSTANIFTTRHMVPHIPIQKPKLRKGNSETYSNKNVSSAINTPGGPSSFSQPSQEAYETPLNTRWTQPDDDTDWGLSTEGKSGLINMLIMLYSELDPNEDWTVVTTNSGKSKPIDSVTAAKITIVCETLTARRSVSTSAFDTATSHRPPPIETSPSVLSNSNNPNEIIHETSLSTKNAMLALKQRIQDAKNTGSTNNGNTANNNHNKIVSFASPSSDIANIHDCPAEMSFADATSPTDGTLERPLTFRSDTTDDSFMQQPPADDDDDKDNDDDDDNMNNNHNPNNNNNHHQSGSKKIKNAAKWRRLTMAHTKTNKADVSMDSSTFLSNHYGHHNNSFTHDSPTVVPKISQKAINKRISNLHKKLDLSRALDDTNDPSQLYQECINIDESNFKGIVIGGTYQHVFDENMPVISMPLATEKRILDAIICSNTNTMVLKLYIPQDETTREISFTKGWCITRASPDGYLISKETLTASKRTICYFLTKYPTSTSTEFTTSTSHNDMEVTSHHCQQPPLTNTSADGIITTTTTTSTSATDVEDDQLEKSILYIPSTDWSNSVIVSYILNYLSPEELVNNAIMSVSKSWAIAYYRVTAKRTSEYESPLFEYNSWYKFINNNAWGKYLSSGACKDGKFYIYICHKHIINY